MRSCVIGSGSYVPERVVTNADLERMVGTSDAWIMERTGIRERRAAAEGERTSDLAAHAARRALEMAGVRPEDVDLIVLGTVTPDQPTPATAALVQAKLGARRALAFDVSAACAGALVALSVADQYVRSGAARYALVIGADLLTRAVDWTDRNTCVLFGDAAGALLLAPAADDEGRGLLSTHLHSDGALAGILSIPHGDTVKMNGREVFRVAVRTLVAAAQEALHANGLAREQVDHVMGHQANLRIIEAVMERVGLPMERFWLTLDRYGNTSAAAIPMCIDEANRAGRLAPGELVLMLAAGAGFVWGSGVMRW
ncbi:MAG: ketoacyl-ACP synthase III [Deltaproteobacteria bacterium]|nr:ketoacyl-ACP synthase III [Deltaproteobacteria bacterium]